MTTTGRGGKRNTSFPHGFSDYRRKVCVQEGCFGIIFGYKGLEHVEPKESGSVDEAVDTAKKQMKCVEHTTCAWNERKQIPEVLATFLIERFIGLAFFSSLVGGLGPIASGSEIGGAVDTSVFAVRLFQSTHHQQKLHVAREPTVDVDVTPLCWNGWLRRVRGVCSYTDGSRGRTRDRGRHMVGHEVRSRVVFMVLV